MVHSRYKYSDFISDRTGGPQISGQNNMPIIYSQFVTAKNISSSRRRFWIPNPFDATEMMSRTYQFHRKAPNRCGPKRPQISTDDGNRYGTTLIFPLESTVSSVTSCMHTYVVFLPWKTSDFIGDPIYCESYYSYVDSVVIFAKL